MAESSQEPFIFYITDDGENKYLNILKTSEPKEFHKFPIGPSGLKRLARESVEEIT